MLSLFFRDSITKTNQAVQAVMLSLFFRDSITKTNQAVQAVMLSLVLAIVSLKPIKPFKP